MRAEIVAALTFLAISGAAPASAQNLQMIDPLLVTITDARKQTDETISGNGSNKTPDQIMRDLSGARLNIVRVQTMARKEIERYRDTLAAAREEARTSDGRIQGSYLTLQQIGADSMKDDELQSEAEKRKKTIETMTADYEKKVADAQAAIPAGGMPTFVPMDQRLFQARIELNALQAVIQYRTAAKQRQDQVSITDKTARQYENAITDLDYALQRIDDRVQVLLQDNQKLTVYTTISTVAFAFLVAVVIFAFFGIALKSKTVRNAIFTGESGIQFVTLFSLVIAIILFGILRILEGKELSALLGGLSGYILGRGTGMRTEPRKAAVEPLVPNEPTAPPPVSGPGNTPEQQQPAG